MLNWLSQFNIFCFLDSHHYRFPPATYECLLAAGSVEVLSASAGAALKTLSEWQKAKGDWLFGHMAYDLKNEIEPLGSSHPDSIQFPDLYFFIPDIIIKLSEREGWIHSITRSPHDVMNEIKSADTLIPENHLAVHLETRFTKADYMLTVEQLRRHIHRGDCYEINFCQEFFARTPIDPLSVYHSLSHTSPNPFSCLYRVKDKFLICSSPERYLKRTGERIVSQPIKGTWKRASDDLHQDQQNRFSLANSEKERSENVMIVDLVRNDLSKVCNEGSVNVEELFGIYTFPLVHQMISTISGTLRPNIELEEIFRATFPMGSMTGAPKLRVMQLIEQYERTRRGIFSGAVGYIDDAGNFDFNVVIRSIMYNSSNEYVSFLAGSGIIYDSDAEKEYEECLLKASGIKKVLTGKSTPL